MTQSHNRAKTHCPAGHTYDPSNTYISAGRRHCRICTRDRKQAYNYRQATARQAALEDAAKARQAAASVRISEARREVEQARNAVLLDVGDREAWLEARAQLRAAQAELREAIERGRAAITNYEPADEGWRDFNQTTYIPKAADHPERQAA
ncbi:MAG: hypothetical protein R2761_23655 [Acidimicrobiales bacterium]